MIKSMTGFGRGHKILNGRDITVEIRAVNHRYFEFNSRLPRSIGFAEERLKSMLQEHIHRGKVEVSVLLSSVEQADEKIIINKEIVRDYVEALRSVQEEFSLKDDLSLSDIMRMPDAFTVVKTETDEEQLWLDIKSTADEAIEHFLAMREAEGERMKQDILSRLTTIEGWVGEIEKASPQLVADYRKRLYDKMKDVLESANIDESRILLEAGIFSEKTAVDEETVRLHSHIAQFRSMLDGDGQVGRKLDFLVQEMNRETNTIGSKVQDVRVTGIVVDQKSEIEKIREQIQNIE